MAGLNNIISNTAQQTTTMPTWFDTAQQNVVSQAGNALSQAPTPQNTVAQGAVNQLSGPTNAFTNATGTLQNIATGAANPWITDASTGAVSPNTNTALGGLFQAQNQQLQQLMPNVTAPTDAASIASGNFGGLRGQTAYNKAIGDAIAQQNAAQMQAALSNQQTGVQAGIGAGNVAQQGINNALTVGQYQQAAPFTNVSNYGKVLGGIQAPTTVNNQTQLSPLNQIAGLVTALGGQNPAGLMGSIFGEGSPAVGKPGEAGYKAAVPAGLYNQFKNLFGGSSTPTTPTGTGGAAGSYPLTNPDGTSAGSMVINPDGSKTYTDASGTVRNYDASGNPTDTLSPLPETGLPPSTDTGTPDNSGPLSDYTGPAIGYNPTNDAGAPDWSAGYSEGA